MQEGICDGLKLCSLPEDLSYSRPSDANPIVWQSACTHLWSSKLLPHRPKISQPDLLVFHLLYSLNTW